MNMIYTVTFNPSLDYIISVDNFKLGITNRTTTELMLPGGKGINVSMVLKNLGIESTALGFVAGFVGDEIKRRVEVFGCKSDFVQVQSGTSRINVKLKSVDGTEINGSGPNINCAEMKQLLFKLDRMKKGDILVLAGSIPETIEDSIYKDIMRQLEGRGILFVVDATKDLLVNVLEHHPFLVKPNNHELGEIFGVELKKREEVVPYARELQKMGAKNVLVSMAGEGAVLIDEEEQCYMMEAPKGVLINAVGAGDSMVAGFLAGWLDNQKYLHAFKMGVSAGSASAFSEVLATREEIIRVYQQLNKMVKNV